ncbi:MAG: hypothetical protein AAGH68_10385 [Pseudomonadota bacterium]
MKKDKHIVATADEDAPEILEEIALDQVNGGAQYGSSNSCEPVARSVSDWILMDSFPSPTFLKDPRSTTFGSE